MHIFVHDFSDKTLEMTEKPAIVKNVTETDRKITEAAMSLEELREQNKRLTVEKGLELFIKNGVEQTTVRDVATAAGLTERSVTAIFPARRTLCSPRRSFSGSASRNALRSG